MANRMPADHAARRRRYETTHPGVRIGSGGHYWQAVIPEHCGVTIITRFQLPDLLDELEARDGGSPGRVRPLASAGGEAGSGRGIHPASPPLAGGVNPPSRRPP